jgi:AcrR family transcriptional regulator
VSSKITDSGDPGTRARILDAGLEILQGDAPEQLSMGAVAARSSVSRQAVYLHFASRSDLVMAIVNHANERLGLAKRLAPLDRARSSRSALELFVDTIVWQTANLGPAIRAVNRLVESDPELATRWAEHTGRLARIDTVIGLLAGERRLRRGLGREQAATLLYALTLPDPVLAVLSAGYTQQQTARLLHRALKHALCATD